MTVNDIISAHNMNIQHFIVKSIEGNGSQQPVNRVMSVWSGPDNPTPNISCLIGFLSIEITQTWWVNCSEANNYR